MILQKIYGNHDVYIINHDNYDKNYYIYAGCSCTPTVIIELVASPGWPLAWPVELCCYLTCYLQTNNNPPQYISALNRFSSMQHPLLEDYGYACIVYSTGVFKYISCNYES